MNKKKFTLDNLYEGLESEKKENENQKTENDDNSHLVNNFLRNRFSKRRIPQIREGISLPVEDVNFVKELREKIVRFDPRLIPNKSQLYRLGLHLLRNKSVQELVALYKELLDEIDI